MAVETDGTVSRLLFYNVHAGDWCFCFNICSRLETKWTSEPEGLHHVLLELTQPSCCRRRKKMSVSSCAVSERFLTELTKLLHIEPGYCSDW